MDPSLPPERLAAKVCVVGEPGVGKTALLYRLLALGFREAYEPTMGALVAWRTLRVPRPGNAGPLLMRLAVWDITGRRMRGQRAALREAYFHGTDGILAVGDLTNEETIPPMGDWVERVREVAGDVPAMFVGNKADVGQTAASMEELARAAGEFETLSTVASARTGARVGQAFWGLAVNVAGRIARE